MLTIRKIMETGSIHCRVPERFENQRLKREKAKMKNQFASPMRVSDKRLINVYVCELAATFGVKVCQECESQCAYGREYIRRVEIKQAERHEKGRNDLSTLGMASET